MPGDRCAGIIDRVRAAAFDIPDLPPVREVLVLPDGTQVRGFDTEGSDALRWWRRLRAERGAAGWWPLLIDAHSPGYFEQRQSFTWDRPVEPLDGAAVLAGMLAERPPSTREEAERWVQEELQDADRPSRHIPRSGWDWPDDPVRPTVETGPSLAAPGRAVTLVLLPVADGWQVPQVLAYGGWNEYPRPREHAAILRYWNQKWGADLFALTGTTAQFVVSRPPTTRDDALSLALEWSVYNDGEYDYYDADGPMELAASLIDAHAWFAWWD